MIIYELSGSDKKRALARRVLEALPDWFGNPTAREEYIEESGSLLVFAAEEEGNPIGFLALKRHYSTAAEIAVMGVLPEYHRKGAGRQLVQKCLDYCLENKVEFLQVKTLDSSHPDPGYAKTRKFYYAMGFQPLECIPELWGKENPCLLLIQHIKTEK